VASWSERKGCERCVIEVNVVSILMSRRSDVYMSNNLANATRVTPPDRHTGSLLPRDLETHALRTNAGTQTPLLGSAKKSNHVNS